MGRDIRREPMDAGFRGLSVTGKPHVRVNLGKPHECEGESRGMGLKISDGLEM